MKNSFSKIITTTLSVVVVSLVIMFSFSDVSLGSIFGGLLESSINVSAASSEESNVMTQDTWNQAIDASSNQ